MVIGRTGGGARGSLSFGDPLSGSSSSSGGRDQPPRRRARLGEGSGSAAVAPQRSERRDPPEPQEQLEPSLWVGAGRIAPVLFSFFSCAEIGSNVGPRGGVLELLLFNHRVASAISALCFRAVHPCAGTILARWSLTRSSPPEAVASSCASCPARISRRGNLRSWLWGQSAQVLRLCRVARGARTGRGAPAEGLDRKAPNDRRRKHSRGRPRTSVMRLVREKTRQASKNDRVTRQERQQLQ